MIRILFFGPVAERVQMRETNIGYSTGITLQQVIDQLNAQHPKAFDIVSFIAVNQQQVHDRQMPLHDNDEIAFMAKFSGG